MPFQMSWQVENRVVMIDISGILTLDEMAQIDRQMLVMIPEGYKPPLQVHVLVDMRDMTRMPNSIWDINRTLTHFKEPGLGWTVLISTNRLFQAIFKFVCQTGRLRCGIENTLENAMA